MDTFLFYVNTYLAPFIYGVFILIIGWIVANWVEERMIKHGLKAERFDETLVRVFAQIARVFILVFVVIVVLRLFGMQTASLIAVIGGLSVGIGLAWKGVLKDFAAGIMLLTIRPFKTGQVVKFGSHLGVIDAIGIVVTKMHSVNGLDMTVPNSKIWGNVITNMSANETRRLDLKFSFGLNDNMDKAMEVTKEILAEDERVLPEPEPLVAILELKDHSIVMRVRPWAKSPDYWALLYDITKRMKERFDEEGLNMPFPHRHDVRFFQEN